MEEKLNPEEIENISNFWMPGNISFINSYIRRAKVDQRTMVLLDELTKHPVIEIGPGGNPLNTFLECKSYVGVQPFECHVPNVGENYVIMDGLSYLRKQKDKSAIVVSFGVFDTDVLHFPDHKKMGIYDKDKINQYISELIEEVKRVSFPFAIIISADAEHFFGEPEIKTPNTEKGGIYNF
jgi:hypothetical protein